MRKVPRIPKTIHLRGREVKVTVAPSDEFEIDAWSDKEAGEITIGEHLLGKGQRVALVESLIHECLHIAYPDLSERPVDGTARDITAALRRAGLI